MELGKKNYERVHLNNSRHRLAMAIISPVMQITNSSKHFNSSPLLCQMSCLTKPSLSTFKFHSVFCQWRIFGFHIDTPSSKAFMSDPTFINKSSVSNSVCSRASLLLFIQSFTLLFTTLAGLWLCQP